MTYRHHLVQETKERVNPQSANGCGVQTSHPCGSECAAAIVRLRLFVLVYAAPLRFHHFGRSSTCPLQQFKGIGYAACQPKGAEVKRHLLYQACMPHPLSVSQAPHSTLNHKKWYLCLFIKKDLVSSHHLYNQAINYSRYLSYICYIFATYFCNYLNIKHY